MTKHPNDAMQVTKPAMSKIPMDLTVELRSADGTSTEYYQTNEERIQEALRLLADPRLFAQRHLLLTSRQCASMIPCNGIDMIIVRTTASIPVKFPLNVPLGLFDLIERTEDLPEDNSAAAEEHCERKPGQAHRLNARVEIRTFGGWAVSLQAVAVIRGHAQDERHFFSHLPDAPTIPFRLREGGFGLINNANITVATATPKPDALPGNPLPLILRRQMPSLRRGDESALIP
jgi:hypothetical protein